MKTAAHEIAKQIRQEFFVYRNGMLADTLKDAGDKHRMIFGLNISQIVDIAKRFPANKQVAEELWNSKETRECRLIAPMLYPIYMFDKVTALKWIAESENTEIADNLCHKLLRNTAFAGDLCLELMNGTEIERYIAMRLAINILSLGRNIDNNKMHEFASSELHSNNKFNISVAKRLIEDLSELQ